MSYCRCGEDSDVYVIRAKKFCVWFCQGKPEVRALTEKTGEKDSYFDTREETLEYLRKLKSLGFKIPNHTFERLEREIKETKNA